MNKEKSKDYNTAEGDACFGKIQNFIYHRFQNVLSQIEFLRIYKIFKLIEMGKFLSEDLRWRIIYCQAEGFTQKEIAKRIDPFAGRVGRRKIFTRQDMLLPQMNPYPAKHSVLVMDNAHIHHDDDLVTAIENIGGRVLYLPPYSPDFNPIETAFSALKSWLKRYRDLVDYFDPIYLILVALAQTTPEIAKKYFAESIYDV
ncbi:unnamed protein product [Rhizophagus irregularis]|nr:unnamed protein product [Rhizophagus irregularis]